MATKLEELLAESVKEIERRKQELLSECEALDKTMKSKEDEANKRIAQIEETSRVYISDAQKEINKKLNEAEAIRKSLDGSDETLKSVENELLRLDAERKALKDEKDSFEAYKSHTEQQLDDKIKNIELRETKLAEA